MNVLLTEDGQHYQDTELNGGRSLVIDIGGFTTDWIRRAIVTGVFDGAGRRYPCEKEAKEATNMLLSRIADTYPRLAGGAMSWDAIILTGGGSGLLHKRLLPILRHERVILAEDLESIHLANVRGGLKLWRLYEALKAL